MKVLLVVLVLLVAAGVSLGFYQGWFNIATDNAGAKANVTLTVDTDKFQEDRKSATESVRGLNHPEKTNDATP